MRRCSVKTNRSAKRWLFGRCLRLMPWATLPTTARCIRTGRRFSLMREDFSLFWVMDRRNRSPDGFCEWVCQAGREPSQSPQTETPCINTLACRAEHRPGIILLEARGYPVPNCSANNFIPHTPPYINVFMTKFKWELGAAWAHFSQARQIIPTRTTAVSFAGMMRTRTTHKLREKLPWWKTFGDTDATRAKNKGLL